MGRWPQTGFFVGKTHSPFFRETMGITLGGQGDLVIIEQEMEAILVFRV